MSVDWYTNCGQCVHDEKQRGLYPEWATEAEIEESIRSGVKKAQLRPKDWRIYPKEQQAQECD